MLLPCVAAGAVVGTVALIAELSTPGRLEDMTVLTGAAGAEGAGAVALLMTRTGEGAAALGAVIVALLATDSETAGAAAAPAVPARVMFAAGAAAGADAGTGPGGTAMVPVAAPVQGIPFPYRVCEATELSQGTHRTD